MSSTMESAEAADRSFVVVASRLPVDRVEGPDGKTEWQQSPGGLVTALEPVMREAGGAWIGWSGDAGPAPGAFEADGLHLVGLSLSETEVRHFYEGFCNATLWPLYHDVIAPPAVPPPVVGGVRGRQPALRAGRGGTGGAGGDRVGARLPASAGPADAARAARRRPDRLLQPHPVPRLRDLRPASVAAAGGRGPARRRPARLPAPRRRHQLPAGLPPGRRPGHQGVHRAGGRAGRPTGGPGRRVPDLDRREGPGRDRPAGRRRHADQGDQGGGGRAEPDAAGGGPARLHQGHPAPVARLRRAGGRRAARAAAGADPGGQPEPGAGRGVPDAPRRGRGDGGPDQRPVRAGGLLPRALPAPVLPARGDGRAVPGRGRDAGDAAAGRHEPGGQGVRGLPLRRGRRAGAERVHRRGRTSWPAPSW